MDENIVDKTGFQDTNDDYSQCAVNSLVLDYYKKFGRKRDLEQFFSLSTTQSDIRDPKSLFWRKMKVLTDSSDSGDGQPGSSTELCRISIKYTVPEPSSKDDYLETKDDSVSPPIITEEADLNSPPQCDNESVKSDDNNSQKSTDVHLDTSINKPFSPTSSITSQRKLEWDSLGDVGYENEGERKASNTGLSTLERLALHQQYSNNDTKQDTQFGPPTCHSTPVETNISQKERKGNVKKTTKIQKKDVDLVELNVPCSSEVNPTAINVNFTKHISFNVDKDGDVMVEDSKNSVKLTSDKVSVETEMTPQTRFDKEIQTSLTNNKTIEDKLISGTERQNGKHVYEQKFPILIALNTLRKRKRKKKYRTLKKKISSRSKVKKNLQISPQEKSKSIEQVSDAESFEYMPGHIYNQNQINNNKVKDSDSVGNKSSLESSTGSTYDSSKGTMNSFTKDLEKSIDLLKKALQPKYDNTNLKEKLIKEVVQRLLKTRYRDDDSETVFLSGLNLPKSNHTTTSTSDGNNIDTNKVKRPKKSILRVDKFNPNGMASTSQSTPNLHTLAQSDKPSNIVQKPKFSNTESDFSSRERSSSDTAPKMSSEELYNKYLEALKREQIHKKRLRDKETLLKKKLVSSDTCLKTTPETCDKPRDRLYRLIKDLARNNVDDGSGDASRIGDSSSNKDKYINIKKQKSHSVFTLASGQSICQAQNKLQKSCQNNTDSGAGCSKTDNHYCRCAYHNVNDKADVNEISLRKGEEKISQRKCQLRCHVENNTDLHITKKPIINCKKSPRETDKIILENAQDIKYVCICSNEGKEQEVPEKLLIYKCSRVGQEGICLSDTMSKASSSVGIQCSTDCYNNQINDKKLSGATVPDKVPCLNRELQMSQSPSPPVNCPVRKVSASSQTNLNLDFILRRGSSDKSVTSLSSNDKHRQASNLGTEKSTTNVCERYNVISELFHEDTRWTQTDISIDPKISDPTISDVNLVKDLNCSKHINEHERYRNSSQNILPIFENARRNQYTCTNDSKTFSVHENQTNTDNSCNFLKNPKTMEEKNQFDERLVENKVSKPNEDKFSIPIQGTNMTLVVSLGSNTPHLIDKLKNTDLNTKVLTTNKIQFLEKATIFGEECSKGVQCNSTDIFTHCNKKYQEFSKDYDDNNVNNINKNEEITVPYINSCFKNMADDCKYNTYPKNSQNMKPLVRSNTDTCCKKNYVTQNQNYNKIDVETQKDVISKSKDIIKDQSDKSNNTVYRKSSRDSNTCIKDNVNLENVDQYECQKPSLVSKCDNDDEINKDPILSMIQDITKRYTKKDMEKSKRKKCFKEIITVLNYLLDTEESTDQKESCNTDSACTIDQLREKTNSECLTKKTFEDKGVQLSMKKNKKQKMSTESSDVPTASHHTSEFPTTSTDSRTWVLNKIRKECEKYHQKRCKSRSGQPKCVESSTTSITCEKCNHAHHCPCRFKCKTHKSKQDTDKLRKKSVAYNLIIQTSDSISSEETICKEDARPLQNIIVKIPPRHKQVTCAPFKEVSAKIERNLPNCNIRRENKVHRSRSLPNDTEMSSEDFTKMPKTCTVRDYLEKNRPDFVEKSTKRQNCLKIINQTRSNERATKRKLLSMQLEHQQALSALSGEEIHQLARDLGAQLRRKKVAPKFISEREMKKHSEKIYKSLPEVMQKKEEVKKENMKKTNLLMANIFKKNLQKKTLRGSVNLSNYSTVIKI
ncbi:unnamed protein product [Parnassius mnemosyne]|uniref:ALMS motif domain-containing protein n=1 Tax=Parnassius mnemosyne TaxID=213953 RepID=A0AAV1L7A9_9NEOP